MKRLIPLMGFIALTGFIAQMARADIVVGNSTALHIYVDAEVYSLDCGAKQTHGTLDYLAYPGGKMSNCYVNDEFLLAGAWCSTYQDPGHECGTIGGTPYALYPGSTNLSGAAFGHDGSDFVQTHYHPSVAGVLCYNGSPMYCFPT